MLKNITEEITKIMNKHVFLMCKNMHIDGTVVKKRGFARGGRDPEKNIKNDANIHPTIYGKSMQISCLKK